MTSVSWTTASGKGHGLHSDRVNEALAGTSAFITDPVIQGLSRL